MQPTKAYKGLTCSGIMLTNTVASGSKTDGWFTWQRYWQTYSILAITLLILCTVQLCRATAVTASFKSTYLSLNQPVLCQGHWKCRFVIALGSACRRIRYLLAFKGTRIIKPLVSFSDKWNRLCVKQKCQVDGFSMGCHFLIRSKC